MQGVIQSQAPHGPDVVRGQRREEKPDVGDLVGHIMLAEDIALDDVRLGRFGDVRDAPGQDGITVVSAAILGQKADESLGGARVSTACQIVRRAGESTSAYGEGRHFV